MTGQQAEKRTVVCVFCGTAAGDNPVHKESARALAVAFHKNNIRLVYGGGTSGIMGELARTLVSLAGPDSVMGIIPRPLVKTEDGYKDSEETTPADSEAEDGRQQGRAGKAHERTLPTHLVKTTLIEESKYGSTIIVPDMHARKRMMAAKVLEGGPGSGFVALAGGFGTVEEVMEMTTWNQLGIHHVGVVLLNIQGYWDGILAWVKNAVDEGFVSQANANILVEAKDVNEVLPKLVGYQPSKGRLNLNWGQE
ncbi:hypothetical protein Egran_00791 [Elaphomyces granulatus]|uniref:Cytokinin riboside 5'-monophosphate phosphoribohydrolase n=1 Tax=Elaphomyces granulatus TaxID=519963 RepID=A0A232M4U0_9EURO|nr:hypothetical protein Egran_00791 [Elaphomyces granulatus]